MYVLDPTHFLTFMAAYRCLPIEALPSGGAHK